jgi:hypothetical protein
MGVGRTQVQCIIYRKAEILKDYESNMALELKKENAKN